MLRAGPGWHAGCWLEAVLADLDQGACSVLEHGYLTRVERPHGLPVGRRQVRDRISRGVIYRDVEYDVGLVAELDGRVHHDSLRGRDRDFDRDLEAAVLGKRSVRLSYGQVYDRPCWTGERIGRMLDVARLARPPPGVPRVRVISPQPSSSGNRDVTW